MSGIFGTVCNIEPRNLRVLLGDMANKMKHENWYRVDSYQDDDIGLGRSSTGLTNPEEQPIWNASETCCILMEGEIFDYEAYHRKLIDIGYIFRTNSQAEFILHLYEEYGEEFVKYLNGAFVVAIWDKKIKQLLLVTDRFGLQPVYYATHNSSLIFASNVGALLAYPELPRKVDRVAIAQMLTFDHVLDDRTLLSEVHLLRPATILTYQNKQLNLKPYWLPRSPDYYELQSEDEYVEELTFYLRQAFVRQITHDSSSGILLSGGLDSRVILGYLEENLPKERLHTFTFGVPNCDDEHFAREASSRVGVRHHYFELKPDYLLNVAEKGVRLTDGLQSCAHMHSLASIEEEAQFSKLIYKGFMGDALMGYGINRMSWAHFSDEKLSDAHYDTYTSLGGSIFTPREQIDLFSEDFLHNIEGKVKETYHHAVTESGSQLFADQRNYFDLRNRVPRMTLQGVQLVRSHAAVRLPYCDNDLVDFMLKVPPGLRLDRFLMKKVFIKEFPLLAKIPYTETNSPMVPCAREISIRMNHLLRWKLRSAGLKMISPPKIRPYQNYSEWMRTVLRSWVEETLLNKIALNRGYYKPEYIQQTVNEHMAGANHARKLGTLLSIELWHQIYLD